MYVYVYIYIYVYIYMCIYVYIYVCLDYKCGVLFLILYNITNNVY